MLKYWTHKAKHITQTISGYQQKYNLEEVGNKVKKVYLAINNIRLMLKNKSIMMLIIFTSITLSVLGILFYSGYFYTIITNRRLKTRWKFIYRNQHRVRILLE